jgi:hypothetical protein
MIEINLYRQFMVELANRVQVARNNEYPEAEPVQFAAVVAAVEENQLVTLLGDRQGIILCGNIPGARLVAGSPVWSEGTCVLFILEKSPKDRQGTDWEFGRYAVMQQLMSELCKILLGQDAFQMLCQSGTMRVNSLDVGPEYNIYGGFNGWSVSFKLPDGKGAGLQ